MECLGAPYAFLIYFFAYLSKKKEKRTDFENAKSISILALVSHPSMLNPSFLLTS
jgi:hypothetical protein